MIEKGSIRATSIGINSTILSVGYFVKGVFDDLGGETSNGDNFNAKLINSKLSIFQIEQFENEIIDKIINGDQTVCKEIIKSTLKFLELNKINSEYFQSLLTVAIIFITDVSIDEVNANPDLQLKFKLGSQVLGITEEQLEFLFDLISGSPLRLFKIK